MRDAVSNKERWKGRRTPTQDPSTDNTRRARLFDEEELLGSLPPQLQMEIHRDMYEEMITRIPFVPSTAPGAHAIQCHAIGDIRWTGGEQAPWPCLLPPCGGRRNTCHVKD